MTTQAVGNEVQIVDVVARSVAEIEQILTSRGLRMAKVSGDSIYPQCKKIERIPIIAQTMAGEPRDWLFAWGRLIERNPTFSMTKVMVAVESNSSTNLS